MAESGPVGAAVSYGFASVPDTCGREVPVLFPGTSTGSWLIDDLVGLGMPRTYKARHLHRNSECRLKVMPRTPGTLASQRRETEALANLRHDALTEVVDFGTDDEQDFIWTAFDWFEAEPLEDGLLAGPMDWDEAAALFRILADALAYVHGAGILHRDIRPKNILVAPEGVRSFGGAWLTGFDYAMTQHQLEQLSQAPVGDLAYLAPEVLRDPTHHGARADVYAFGCLMYEVLTAEPAFPAAAFGGERNDQARAMFEWKTRTDALDPGDAGRGDAIPGWLRDLVRRSTQPDPDHRLPDVDSVVRELDAHETEWSSPDAMSPADLGPPPTIRMPTAPLLRPGPAVGARPRPPEPRSRPLAEPVPARMMAQWVAAGVGIGLVIAAAIIAVLELGFL